MRNERDVGLIDPRLVPPAAALRAGLGQEKEDKKKEGEKNRLRLGRLAAVRRVRLPPGSPAVRKCASGEEEREGREKEKLTSPYL